MKIVTSILLATAIFATAGAYAQGLVPTLDREYEFCENRPEEPQWLQDIHVRENYKRLLVQAIYRFQSYDRVEQAGDCSCDTLYPSWDTAVQVFNDNYLHLERRDAMDTRREFQDRSNDLRQSQRDVCEPIGHW